MPYTVRVNATWRITPAVCVARQEPANARYRCHLNAHRAFRVDPVDL